MNWIQSKWILNPVNFRRVLFVGCVGLMGLLVCPGGVMGQLKPQDDSLVVGHTATVPSLGSWRDCTTKRALEEYVARVTDSNHKDFVPIAERIAVFDNDGTLWPENPLPFQLAYAFDVVTKKAASDAEFAKHPMVQAVLKRDVATLLSGQKHEGLLQVVAMTHAGMTTDEFSASVEAWMATAKHPRYERAYDRLTYEPMQEVLRYLRHHGFKTYIVSGGGADFMRVWSERVYGIGPEQVIGSSARTKFEMREGKPVLIKTLENLFVDDKAGKPVGIQMAIGRRPIVCFGNSDGDYEMLQYTTIGNPRASFGAIVHHTDAEREYAYDSAPSSSGKLVRALEEAPSRGWYVVDMKSDWFRVFQGE
jgi:phosphoglycolate phosphatase-like HAD superfamily hydrolase